MSLQKYIDKAEVLIEALPYITKFNTENIQTATLPGTTPNLNETNGVSVFVVNKTATTAWSDGSTDCE